MCGVRTARLCAASALLLVGGIVGCSDGRGDDAAAEKQPVATVGDRKIVEHDVATLAGDAGFLAFIGAPELPKDEELSQTEAGRRVLTWLIDKAVVDNELEDQHLQVEDSTVETATEALQSDSLPATADDVIGEVEDMGRHATDETALGIAAYMTLDQWLREIDPGASGLHSSLLADHPEVADRVCGAAVAVDVAQAKAVRDHLAAGGIIDGLGPAVPTLARTAPGGDCMTRGSFPRQIVNLLYGTPIGSSGEQEVVSRSTGTKVVLFAVPAIRDRVAGDDADAAVQTTLQRLHDQGGAAFSELAFSTLDPRLDERWGRWDPGLGVVASDAPLGFSTTALPPTPTTIVPVTTATAAQAPPTQSQFVVEAAPVLSGSGTGDPGTGDLTARAVAALTQAVPGNWRGAVPVTVSIISGSTSLSYTDGRLEVGSAHASGDWVKLETIMAHEFGHHIAYRYGTQAELGAAPAGWPTSGNPAVERWADCVSQAFTGYPVGSHGQSPCDGPSQTWTTDWLGVGPAAHPRTA